jgi:3-phenylpropionate/trans-cinnamate dioxygenase ferredoxin reductase subunit
MSVDVLIVGGGLAGARVAQSYREAGGGGSIRILAAEAHLPYHRPGLTKRVLRGEQEPSDTLVLSSDNYRELDVELELEAKAQSVDVVRRELTLADGATVPFERLVIATGALPRHLPVPGADLPGVFAFRTIDDSMAVREAASAGQSAVIVGTGFIGLEVAASLNARGVDVTLVDRAAVPFEALGAPAFSSYLVELYREQGIEMVLDDGITEFRGDGVLAGVVTPSGRELAADLAVVGVGVAPATEWLEGSTLELDNGVVVDARYRAAEGIYAVGDVARFSDPLFGRSRRIEHWSNADYHGRQIGRILAGEDLAYDRVSTFFTEIFGTAYKFFGDATGAQGQELEGSFVDGRAVIRYFEGDRLRAALLTGQTDTEEAELEARIRKDALALGRV